MSKKVESTKTIKKVTVKRPGIHSKSKSSKLKSSKNYVKPYARQGK